MEKEKSRFYKFAVLFFLGGIFIELFVILGILFGTDHPSGNIAVVELKDVIETSGPTIQELKKYEKNDKVKAIILRVNSPGGTVGASQEINEEVTRISQKKKIIASFGDMAASGGYYAACGASRIVANPGTITGSIGVISHHFVVEDLLKKLHLRWEVIQAGKLKDLGSPLRNFRPEEKELLQNMTRDMHEQFIEAVAQGRKLPLEEVRKLADGRIFSGRQAKERKLVDDLGGLEKAILLAAKLVNLSEEPKVIYPEEERFGWLRSKVENAFSGSKLQVKYQVP